VFLIRAQDVLVREIGLRDEQSADLQMHDGDQR